MSRPEEKLIDARYRVLERLGAGSMGVVYLAEDVFLDRRVAVKVIDPVHASDPATTERFKKEARALAKIRHENVVQIYAFGPHDESFYFAMEYVPGRSLEKAIDAGDTVDVEQGLGVLGAIAGGLDAVHDLKLVHRDVKPSNIVLEQGTERPVLIDFGLARRRSASNPRISIAAGTPMYMAPEQAADPNGTNLTFKADIYALACTGYEVLTGHPVFDGRDVFEILLGHMKRRAPPLSRHRPDLSALDAAFDRALAKAPEDRHPSASAFVRELDEALKQSARKKHDTIAPPAQRDSTLPSDRVLLLAREEGLVKQMRRVTTRAFASVKRNALVEQVSAAGELLASFVAEPTSLVVIDDDSAERKVVEVVQALRSAPGGRGASILVVSRDWQALRPALAASDVPDVLPKPLAVQMLAAAVERMVARRLR